MTKGPVATEANTHSHCGSHGEVPPRSPFKELDPQPQEVQSSASSCQLQLQRSLLPKITPFLGQPASGDWVGSDIKHGAVPPDAGHSKENAFSRATRQVGQGFVRPASHLKFSLWPILLPPPSFHRHWTLITPISIYFSVTQHATHHNTCPQGKIQASRLSGSCLLCGPSCTSTFQPLF